MKTKKLLLGALLLMGTSGMAQDLGFGIKAGANYNLVTVKDFDSSTGIGFHFGPTLDLGLSDMLNFRIELLGSMRTTTSKVELDFLGVKTVSTSKVSPLYLTIPILYKYEVGSLNLFAGPQLNFLLTNKVSNKTTVNGDEISSLEISGENATAGMRAFEFGVAAGAEYGLSDNLNLGLRYVRSLQSIADSDNGNSFYNIIQLSGVYKF